MARNYTVAISKVYFPEKFWKTASLGQFNEYAEVLGIRASSRTEAAETAWKRHGKRWRENMKPQASKLIVRLHVNDPLVGAGGYVGRLVPVRVFYEEIMDVLITGL